MRCVSGRTILQFGKASILNVSFAGVIGRPAHWPGTGTACVSVAETTICTRPCTYSGSSSGPVSLERKLISPTRGVVPSE